MCMCGSSEDAQWNDEDLKVYEESVIDSVTGRGGNIFNKYGIIIPSLNRRRRKACLEWERKVNVVTRGGII